MKIDLRSKWAPFIIAVAVATGVLIYYVSSGRSSYDLQVRELGKTSGVQKIDSTNSKKITIKCKSGENYQIDFDGTVGNYDGLIFNACGEEGGTVADETATEEVAVSEETVSQEVP